MTLPPQSGTAFTLARNDVLSIIALEPEQVADVALFAADTLSDAFSPGRTMDYNERITLRIGDHLYSSGSLALAQVVKDSVGVHDMLLAPCSEVMFARRGQMHHPSCHANIVGSVGNFGIDAAHVTATLNVFMDVRLDGGALVIFPPASARGDVFAIRACRDLIVAVAACSSELTNNGRCKAIGYRCAAAHPIGVLPALDARSRP